MKESPQFLALLRDRAGRVVERREGHNVLTDYGRQYFAERISIAVAGTPDTPMESDMIRFLAVGGAGALAAPIPMQLELSTVTALTSPLAVDVVPNYMVACAAPPLFPAPTIVRWTYTFAFDELSLPAAVIVQESGLYEGNNATDTTWAGGEPSPVAYKTFDPILKTTDFSLEIRWEFRF